MPSNPWGQRSFSAGRWPPSSLQLERRLQHGFRRTSQKQLLYAETGRSTGAVAKAQGCSYSSDLRGRSFLSQRLKEERQPMLEKGEVKRVRTWTALINIHECGGQPLPMKSPLLSRSLPISCMSLFFSPLLEPGVARREAGKLSYGKDDSSSRILKSFIYFISGLSRRASYRLTLLSFIE